MITGTHHYGGLTYNLWLGITARSQIVKYFISF